MRIRSAAGLRRAVHEFQGLEKAKAGSPEAKRRDDLAAAIEAYYREHGDELEKAKPEERAFDRSVRDHPGETE